jgi:hypothetical protein
MANPFPGMDPYLEDAAASVIHANLTEVIARQLVPKLRPKYLVLTEQRFVTVERIPLKTVEIWDAEHRRLVTAIEVLSPTNKRGEGRIEYAAKRQSIMRSDTHLIEIDLLRAGSRFPVDEPLPPAAAVDTSAAAPRRRRRLA